MGSSINKRLLKIAIVPTLVHPHMTGQIIVK